MSDAYFRYWDFREALVPGCCPVKGCESPLIDVPFGKKRVSFKKYCRICQIRIHTNTFVYAAVEPATW